MDFSPAQVQQLSPDDASLKAAKGLVIPAKWKNLGKNDRAIWGECQGSGSKPYQVQVDVSGPAFKCSCPSRKFPCKHGLALLLLLQNASLFTSSDELAWVTEWLDSRQAKAEKQAAKKEEAATKAVDPEAQAKREQQREARMASGLEELSSWMQDQIRQGLQLLPSRTEQMEHLASRMVDSQLPGIAARIRQWPEWLESNDNWSEKILGEWGLLQLLIDAFPKLPQLDKALKGDILSTLGTSFDKNEILTSGEIIQDEWIVLGISIYEKNRLWTRRSWLQSRRTQKIILMLDFSHGMRKFDQQLISGSAIDAKIALQPGRGIQRGIFVEPPVVKATSSDHLPELTTLEQSLNSLTKQIAENPWRFQQALVICNSAIYSKENAWFLISENKQIPLVIENNQAWSIYSEAGGESLHFFGEWEDGNLCPLSAWKNDWLWHRPAQGDE